MNTTITPVYRDDNHIVFRCADLFYPNCKDRYFVLSKTDGYGYFKDITQTFSEGQLLDEFGIKIDI